LWLSRVTIWWTTKDVSEYILGTCWCFAASLASILRANELRDA
jgi:hypothetical protein